MSLIQVDKIIGANGLTAPSFPKGVAKAFFPLRLASTNQLIIAGGYMYLDDGRELATWNGVSYGADIQVNLKTEVSNSGVSSLAVNTAYYLYLKLSAVGAVVFTPIGRAVRPVQKGASGGFAILGTAPYDPATNKAEYLYLGVLRTDNSLNFTQFEVAAETQYPTGGSAGGLGGSYSTGGTITTTPLLGSVFVAGTEALEVTADGGLEVTNAIKLGAAGAQLELQYYDSLTLADASTAVVAEFTYSSAAFEGMIIDYKVKADLIGVRVGRLFIANLANTDLSIVDTFSETSDVGLNWALSFSGANVRLSYTTTLLDVDRVMRAEVKRIRA